jgi:hypothetical protein
LKNACVTDGKAVFQHIASFHQCENLTLVELLNKEKNKQKKPAWGTLKPEPRELKYPVALAD